METAFDTTPVSGRKEVHDGDGFDSEADAYAFLERLRWGTDGPTQCPHCGSDKGAWFLKPKDPNGRLAKGGSTSRSHRRVWKCRENSCRRQFSVLTNTVMHGTKMPVQVWVGAIVDLCRSKEGVSAREISTRWDVTEKSAWALLNRIEDAITSAKPHGENPLSDAVKWLEVSTGDGAIAAESSPPTAPPAVPAQQERARVLAVHQPTELATTPVPALQEHLVPAPAAPVEERIPGVVVPVSSAPVVPEKGRVEERESAAAQVKSDVERALAEAFAEPAAAKIDRPIATPTRVESEQDAGLDIPAVDDGRPSARSRKATGWSEKTNKRRLPRAEETMPDAAPVRPSRDDQQTSTTEKTSAKRAGSEHSGRHAADDSGPSEVVDSERPPRPSASRDDRQPVQSSGELRPSKKKKKRPKKRLENNPETRHAERQSAGTSWRETTENEGSETAEVARDRSLSVQPPRGRGSSEKSQTTPRSNQAKPESRSGDGGSRRSDTDRSEPAKAPRNRSLSVQSPGERGRSEGPKTERRPRPATAHSGDAKELRRRKKKDGRAPGATAPRIPQPVDNLSDVQLAGELGGQRPPPPKAPTASPTPVVSDQPSAPQAHADELGGGWLETVTSAPLDSGHSISQEQGQLAGIGRGVLGNGRTDADPINGPTSVVMKTPPSDQLDLFSGDLDDV